MIILRHLSQLARYSNHLPLSWFTPALLDALMLMKDKFSGKGENANLLPIYSLWAVWVRRLSGTPDTLGEADQQQLLRVLSSMEQALLDNNEEILDIRKEAWIGLVALIGGQTTVHGYPDSRLIQIMTAVIQKPKVAVAMGDTLDAGVAHCLAQSTTLNSFEIEHLQLLLTAHVQLAAQRPDGPRAVMTVLEHAVDVRSQQKPQSRAEADLESLVGLAQAIMDSDGAVDNPVVLLTRLSVVVGIVRTLQFTQGRKTKKVRRFQEEVEALYIKYLDIAVTAALNENQAYNFAINQDTVAFLSGQCLPNIPSDTMKRMNLVNLLNVLVSCLLTSDNIWKGGQIIHFLKNTPDAVDIINELSNRPLYKDIGRISRSVAKVFQVMLSAEQNSEGVIQETLDRLVGFSYNVLVDWDRFITSNPEINMDTDAKKTYKDLDTAVWSLFKTMIFAFTAILKAVAVDVPGGQGLLGVNHAERFGSGTGFTAYQDTLTNSVAYLTHNQNTCQLNKLLSLAYREYAPQLFTMDNTHPVSLLSSAHQSRLTFFTNLVEQVMSDIDDAVLEEDILPVIYPILLWKRVENQELFESAHAAILGIFSAQKPVAREVAGVYAKILIKGFPDPMTLHQLRFAYTTMIQSLCEMDDALSWLTVSRLTEEIHSLSEEKDAVLRSQYTVALIDLLKPLSLGPFFGQILQQIKNLVLQQETPAMRQATLKMLFETVSGSGISDMRRVEAVGWFLDLKQHVS
ncbi:hypothetical protein DFQ30_002992 [Apophysomyces sp. BC1015]|nr:hypothetical protein DFQ30_002992 [Apophysomyces sp. BC1015]